MAKRQFLGSSLPALLGDTEWLEHMATCAHCLANPFDLCGESRRLWEDCRKEESPPVERTPQRSPAVTAKPGVDWHALAERGASALSPFATIGGLLFASTVTDTDAMVQVQLANGQAIRLSRGHFKAAYEAMCAIRAADR